MDIKELYKLYQQHPCITTDSRNCPEGSIFLALKGASFNGNQFALQALEKGCAYAIVDEDVTQPSANHTSHLSPLTSHLSLLNSSSLTTACKPTKIWLVSTVASLTFPWWALLAPTAKRPPRN